MTSPVGRKARKRCGLPENELINEVFVQSSFIGLCLVLIRLVPPDYLMYGRFYLPTGRLDALYSTRLSPTIQAMVAAISDPPSNIPAEMRGRNANVSNVMLSLQHDIGKWCTEYNYSAEDGMWGVRFLHNFGRLGVPLELSEEASRVKVKRVDEEDAVDGGLKGRVSIGAELYFSAKEKSAGGLYHLFVSLPIILTIGYPVSTGIRFTTLPDATPPSAQLSSSTPTHLPPSPICQPPTTVTCLFNPMLGHISTAYTAKTSRDLALSTRFDFNVYSFESEWTMGGEYWLRRKPHFDEDKSPLEVIPSSNELSLEPVLKPVFHPEASQDVQGVLKARISTNNVSSSHPVLRSGS
jgi:distribution and morphology protein 10